MVLVDGLDNPVSALPKAFVLLFIRSEETKEYFSLPL